MMTQALRRIGSWCALTRYRAALWVFFGCFALYTSPFWAGGAVLAPSCRTTLLGITTPGEQFDPCGLQKFADYETEFLPEIANQLRTSHSGLVALRSSANEFDRPAKHITGNTPANITTWVFYRFSADPVVIVTSLTLALAAGTGVFTILLAREWQLAPLAGFAAAVLTSMGAYVSYWQTYPMHVATVCWSTALAWGIVRWYRRGDLVAWVTLLYAIYSIVLMGYPQSVVYVAWVLGAYVVWQQGKRLRAGLVRTSMRDVAALGAAVVGALVLAAPVLVDVAAAYAASARVAAPDEYYLQYILRIKAPWVLVLYAALHTVPELYGTATDVAYPFRFDGFAVSLLPLWLCVVALWYAPRRVWGWALAACVLVVISTAPAVFGWLLHALPGFALSQWTPHWNAQLPVTILVLYGSDSLLARAADRRRAAWVALLVPLAAVGAGVVVAGWYTVAIAPERLGWSVLVVGLCALWLWRRRAGWLFAALVVTVAASGYAYQARRDPATVAQQSTLVDTLAPLVHDGARVAVVEPELEYLLAPNANRLYDIATVHTYNNFTPPAYQQAINGLGGKTTFYGKLNTSIAPNYDTPLFWLSNIGVVLSRTPIDHPALRVAARVGPVVVQTVARRMGPVWHLPLSATPHGQDVRLTQIPSQPGLPITGYRDSGDALVVDVTPQPRPSLLLFSVLQRPQWQAIAVGPAGDVSARSVSVNGVYVGVIVPAATTQVRLTYVTPVQWMWVSHTAWALVWLGYAVYAVRRWQRPPAA